MSQTAIPYLFMRRGTSRGPYFQRSDLPKDRGKLAEVLIAAVGSGHPLNIDGIDGGIDDEVGRAGADGTKTGGWPPLLSVGGLGRAVRD